MSLRERENLLRAIADGDVSLGFALGVRGDDVAALTRVGAAALATGRGELAERVFSGLMALEPHARVHALHLAAARHARGDAVGALAAVNAALDGTPAMPAAPASAVAASSAPVERLLADDEVDALLLRAELRGRTDPAAALADLTRARALSSDTARSRR